MKGRLKNGLTGFLSLSLFVVFTFPFSSQAVSLSDAIPQLKSIANIKLEGEKIPAVTPAPQSPLRIGWPHISLPKFSVLSEAASVYTTIAESYDSKLHLIINGAADQLASAHGHQSLNWPEENLRKEKTPDAVAVISPEDISAAILPVIKKTPVPKTVPTSAPQILKTQPLPSAVPVSSNSAISEALLQGLTSDIESLKTIVATLPRATLIAPKDSSTFIPPVLNSGNIILSGNTISTSTSGLTINAVAGLISISNNVNFGGTLAVNGVTYTWPSSNGSAGQALLNDGSGVLTWGSAAVQGNSPIRVERSQTIVQAFAGAVSFANQAFTVTASGGSEALVGIDYANGPASRSIAQTITGVWTFVNGASVSTNIEISGYSSIGGNIITRGIIISSSTGSNSFSGSLNLSKSVSALSYLGGGLTNCDSVTGKLVWNNGQFSCQTDVTGGGGGGGTTVEIGASNPDSGVKVSSVSFDAGGFNVSNPSGYVLIGLDYTNGPASRSIAQTISGLWTFSGGASFSAPFELSSTASIGGNITSRGLIVQTTTTGSNSFSGSLTTSLGLHAVNVDTTGVFRSTSTTASNSLAAFLTIGKQLTVSGASSNSFSGGLEVSKGIHATTGISTGGNFQTSGLIFQNTSTGSNSFSGSLTSTKGIHASNSIDTAGMFLSTGTGSNSFAGSLNLAKGLHAIGNITTTGTGSSSFAGSLTTSLGLHAVNVDTTGVFRSTSTTASNSLAAFLTIGKQLTVSGAASNSFSGSLTLSKGVHATNSIDTLAAFVSTSTAASNAFSGHLTIGKQLTVSGASSNSFSGSLTTTKGLHATLGIDIGGNFQTSGLIFQNTSTGSNSFSGSLTTTKGIHSTNSIDTAGMFLSTGAGSNSFAGSLDLAKGVHAIGNLATTGLILQSSATGSNSFSGSLTTTKGIHSTNSIDTAGMFLSSGTGSNSFSGSLNLAKGLTALSYQGGGLVNCTAAQKITYTNGQFSCSTDLTGGGGGTQIEIGASNPDSGVKVSSVSFDANAFKVNTSGGYALVALNYGSAGPASKSFNETISGIWNFSNGASISSALELAGTASIGGNITTKGIIVQTTTTGSNSFSGSLTTTKGLHATLGIDIGGNFQTSGLIFQNTSTGSNSFSGSLTTTKGIHSTNSIDTAGMFLSTGTSSNSFSGSLNLSKGLTALSYQGGGLGTCGDSSHALSYLAGQFGCQSITGGAGIAWQSGMVAGQLAFYRDASTASGSAKLTWDSSNKRLGINSGGAVDTTFEVGGTASISGLATFGGGASYSANISTLNSGINQKFSSFTPRILKSFDKPGLANTIEQIRVSGRYAFLAADQNSGNELDIVDMSNPASASFVGGIDLGGGTGIYRFSVQGNLIALGTLASEFRLYDLSNIAAPKLLSTISPGAAIDWPVIAGKYLYTSNDAVAGTCSTIVATGCELRIYDISNPRNPVFVNGLDTALTIDTLQIYGKYAIVQTLQTAGTCNATTVTGCELRIYDISDPYNIKFVNGVDLGASLTTPFETQIYGKYLYASMNGLASGTCGGGVNIVNCNFKIFDISDISNIKGVGGIRDTVNINLFQISGKYAYLPYANGTTGNSLQIWDISDPSNMTLVSSYVPGANSGAIGLYGRYLLLGLDVITGTTCPAQCEIRVVDLNGIDAISASIGTITTNALTVGGYGYFGDTLSVGNALNVGLGGILSGGSLGISVASTSPNALALNVTNSTSGTIFGITNRGFVGVGTATPNAYLSIVDPNTGALAASGSFSIRSLNTVGTVASISANSLTTGTAFRIRTTSAVTGNILSISANGATAGTIASISAAGLTTGRVFDITVPASSSSNRVGANVLRVTSGAVVTASLSAGGSLALRGAIFTHGGGAAACTGSNTPSSGCIDYAEDMPTDDLSMNAGDLVSLNSEDEDADFKVVKSKKPYDRNLLGIVSTRPAIVIGQSVRFGEMALHAESGVVPIALAGRVPVKISYENGNIKKGDYITSSLKPGYAAKAVHKGRVIGIALESASLSSGKETVMIYLNTHYIPEGIAINNGAITNTASVSVEDFTKVSDLFGAFVDYLKDAVLQIKKLVTNEIDTQAIKTHSGVTTYDEQTGEPYCISVSGGHLVTTKGECGSPTSAPSVSSSPSLAPSSTPTPTPTPTPSESAAPTPEPEVTPTSDASPSPTPEPAPAPSETPAPTPVPEATP